MALLGAERADVVLAAWKPGTLDDLARGWAEFVATCGERKVAVSMATEAEVEASMRKFVERESVTRPANHLNKMRQAVDTAFASWAGVPSPATEQRMRPFIKGLERWCADQVKNGRKQTKPLTAAHLARGKPLDVDGVVKFMLENPRRFCPVFALDPGASEADVRGAFVVSWFVTLPSRPQSLQLLRFGDMTVSLQRKQGEVTMQLLDWAEMCDWDHEKMLEEVFELSIGLREEKMSAPGEVVQRIPLPAAPVMINRSLYLPHQLVAYVALRARHARLAGTSLRPSDHVVAALASARGRTRAARNGDEDEAALTAERIANILGDLTFEAIGVPAKGIAWRSTTSTRMRQAGVTEVQVMVAGGWRSLESMQKIYARQVPLDAGKLRELVGGGRSGGRLSVQDLWEEEDEEADGDFAPTSDESSIDSSSLSPSSSSCSDAKTYRRRRPSVAVAATATPSRVAVASRRPVRSSRAGPPTLGAVPVPVPVPSSSSRHAAASGAMTTRSAARSQM